MANHEATAVKGEGDGPEGGVDTDICRYIVYSGEDGERRGRGLGFVGIRSGGEGYEGGHC